VARAFWWGLQIEITSQDLSGLLNAADPNGDVVQFVRNVLPGDYAKWIDVIAPFIVAGTSLLRGLDKGRGVYISMSWFAPGILIPTTV
jgi:type IV secretory pathway VirB2 component (pilin)